MGEESRGFGGPVEMLLPLKISCSNLQLTEVHIKTSIVSMEVLQEREGPG